MGWGWGGEGSGRGGGWGWKEGGGEMGRGKRGRGAVCGREVGVVEVEGCASALLAASQERMYVHA